MLSATVAAARHVLSALDRLLIRGSIGNREFDAEAGWGWLPSLALVSSIGIFVAAIGAYTNRLGYSCGVPLFYAALATLTLPIAGRLAWPAVSRRERLALVLLLTMALYVAKTIREPIGFIDHDTFLHWVTANNILHSGRLFTPNPLLPVSPLFPGLEIATTAIVSLTGLSVFSASVLLMAAVRFLFVVVLFQLYERLSHSSYVAGMSCFIYMGCNSFFGFDAAFSYESLALTLLALILLTASAPVEGKSRTTVETLVLFVPFFIALSVTHHMTAYIAIALLAGASVLEFVRRSPFSAPLRMSALAVLGAAILWSWTALMGHPLENYLGPMLDQAIQDIPKIFSSHGRRVPFQGEDGNFTPWWQSAITVSSIVLIALGLTVGFLRALVQAGIKLSLTNLSLRVKALFGWSDSWLVLLTLVTLSWPASILLRLTSSGWEIGNRLSPFAFLGVGIVIAIGIAATWPLRSGSPRRAALLSLAGTAVLFGGVISGQGQNILVGPIYRVSADASSIEPAGVSAAVWTRAWLGSQNRFIADRVNRLLVATYGEQQVVTTLYDRTDPGPALLFAPEFKDEQRALLREADVDFILADLRLTTQLPAVGFYFDANNRSDMDHEEPPSPEGFLKFNRLRGVSRVFDNGYVAIYDMRSVRDAK